MNTYQLIEDNAGGLHLFVCTAQTNEFIFAGRMSPDDVQAAIANIDEARVWDEDMELLADYLKVDTITTPEQVYIARVAYYADLTRDTHGWAVVADEHGVYPDNMGAAAQQAPGLAPEQDTTL